jgi:nucleoside-diphosphate-sugar epimerase
MIRRQVALLTGATGFIGTALAQELLQRGVEVRALTSRDSRQAGLDPSIAWFGLDDDSIEAAASDAAFFFHFAVVYDRPTISDEEIERVNVQLPLKVLAALARHGQSPTCVFGDSFFRKFPAQATVQPRYTASKTRLADALLQLGADYPCRRAMLLIEQVYGPGDSMEKVFPSVTNTLLRGEVKRLALTEGLQERDFIHRDDVVSAALATAWSEWAGCVEVPCGSGQAVPVRDVFTKLKALTGASTELGFGDIPTNQAIETSVADTSWLASRGWQARKSLDMGLCELVEDLQRRAGSDGRNT